MSCQKWLAWLRKRGQKWPKVFDATLYHCWGSLYRRRLPVLRCWCSTCIEEWQVTHIICTNFLGSWWYFSSKPVAHRQHGGSSGKKQVIRLYSWIMFTRDWLGSLERQPFLLPLTVYTLLRLIPDHHLSPQQASLVTSNPSVHLSKLRQKELVLVEELVRKNVSY